MRHARPHDRRGVTIRDVAREAGVSVATVSRAFNESGPVREETRRRIREVATRLRYSPSGAARSLIIRRTGTLGVLFPYLFGEFFSEIMRGIDQTAQHSGYHLLVSSSHQSRGTLQAALRSMRGRVDGLIVMSPDVDVPSLVENLPEGLPLLLLNCRVDAAGYDTLNIDNFGGAYAMVRHLVVDHGHRRVALVQGPAGNPEALARQEGYRSALRDHGAACDPDLEIEGDFTEHAGSQAARRLLELEPGPTAVFAANDSMAIGVLSALREAGIEVPAQVAVAGFDDIPVARYLNPPLSSVRVGIHELGAHACQRLLRCLREDGTPGADEVLPVRLSLRLSCGCPDSALGGTAPLEARDGGATTA